MASDSKLIAYSGDPLPVIGKIKLQISHANMNSYIVNKSAVSLIGLQSLIDLGLIKLTYSIDNNTPAMKNLGTKLNKQTVMNNYGDLFKGVGLTQEPPNCT